MKMTINLDLVNEDDAERLMESYNALDHKHIEIVDDDVVSNHLAGVFNEQSVFDGRCNVRFVNIFRFELVDRDFYLIHVEIDAGYKFSPKYGQRDMGVEYQIWGYARCKVSFGKTLVRPLTSVDKLVDRFFSVRMKLKTSAIFTSKYYLSSNQRKHVESRFREPFLDAVGRMDDVVLVFAGNDLIVGVPAIINAHNTKGLHRMLMAADFIEKALKN
ncbi:hypothetical protein [Chitinophaga cymbidii]|uniref:Uncharacterized protein n=1 Tax=Chitinophaga cymbidii TaxID=1096750 RepID=A0A512RLD6_9BACT|nr:hypothetical protein [Chitinophaga cymbidii]GEP96525.1 hypothetical protein CCY01nite_27850 [Chitinophaga cymbidii]